MTREAPRRGFPKEEFARRTQTAQALMAEQDLSGLLLMTEPEVRYFTGFQTQFWQSPSRPWFVFVPQTGLPTAIIPEIGAALMATTWVDDIRTWSAPAPQDDGISLLVDLLSPLARANRAIGVLKGHETHLRMPLGDYERLVSTLPGLKIKDATGLVRSLRLVKSEAEIAKISHACAIGSATFARVPEFARSGIAQSSIFREFKRTALAEGADDVPYLVGGAGPGGYRDVISPPDARALQHADILMLDTGCVWDGYYCDFDRNFAIGGADDQSRRAYDVLWRATEAGMDAARPGNTCRDLFGAMAAVIRELDDTGGDVGRLGHGLGMQLTEWPSHAAWDDTILQQNMVLTLEPSLSYGDGKMMVHEENILITSAAPRLLTRRAPPALQVI